jgi:hypothetical protein
MSNVAVVSRSRRLFVAACAGVATGLLTRLLLLIISRCIPVLNSFVFSGHGGPGWFGLALCFPLFLVNTYRLVVKPARLAGARFWKAASAICLIYLVTAYPLGALAENRITAYSGLPIEDHSFYRLMTLPVGLILPPWHSTN